MLQSMHPEARCKPKTGRHYQDRSRRATNHRRLLTRLVLILATGLGFPTRPRRGLSMCPSIHATHSYTKRTRRSTTTEEPRDALHQLKSCQLLHSCKKYHIWKAGSGNNLKGDSRSSKLPYSIGHMYHFC